MSHEAGTMGFTAHLKNVSGVGATAAGPFAAAPPRMVVYRVMYFGAGSK
jgi:hypothetical protein